MKKTILTALLTMVVAVTSYAGPFKSIKEVVIIEPDCLFSDNEFQLDVFYSGIFTSASSAPRLRTGQGGGFGLNYFFARYFGLGYEAFWTSSGRGEHFPLGGNAFFRLPICSWNLAPYAMIGGGVAFDGFAKGYGSVGGGLEYRVTRNVGIFVDSRYFYGGTGSAANLRSGLRFAF
jgi:hypothetical protein